MPLKFEEKTKKLQIFDSKRNLCKSILIYIFKKKAKFFLIYIFFLNLKKKLQING